MAQAVSNLDAGHVSSAGLQAVVAGTHVLTLDGELPVEYLQPGDRILTRVGARILRQVEVTVVQNARVIHISHGTLGIERPTEDVTVSASQEILVRDWRAKALVGTTQALIAATKLADGEYIRAETVAEVRFFSLRFEDDAIVYAGGLELACPALVLA